jgi:tripartite-type tricarboxylate transporter receptor subunit TctC
MTLGVASTVMPHVNLGKLKTLASCSAAPCTGHADGRRGAGASFECSVWFSLVAPAGTPRPVIDKLAAAANAALKSEGVAAKLRAAGFEPLGGQPDAFAKFIAAEAVKWADAAKAAGLNK